MTGAGTRLHKQLADIIKEECADNVGEGVTARYREKVESYRMPDRIFFSENTLFQGCACRHGYDPPPRKAAEFFSRRICRLC